MSASQLTITDLTWDGRGVARNGDGRVIMVPGALPGDVIAAAMIPSPSGSPPNARLIEILKPAPDRVIHPCPHYQDGCRNSPLGAWRYEAALEWKAKHLRETLRRLGGLNDPPRQDLIPSPQLWRYRDRLEFQFSPHHQPPGIGYRSADSFQSLQDCHLGSEVIGAALKALVPAISRSLWFPGNNTQKVTRKKESSPRLLLRDNGRGQAVAVLFVLSTDDTDLSTWQRIFSSIPLAGWQIQQVRTMATRFSSATLLAQDGNPEINHQINAGTDLSIHPLVFSQANHHAAQKLSETVQEWIPPRGDLLDLYGGYGFFALNFCLNHPERRATVVDTSSWALQAGETFAREHDLRLHFNWADSSRPIPTLKWNSYSVALLDPPRRGASMPLLQLLNQVGPPLLLYVSCHPATLARDLKNLNSYLLEHLIPIDLFPQTPDLETLAVLKRR